MDFFEKHKEYINACATIRAWEITRITGRYDIDDYKQEMFLYLLKHIDQYQPERSCPHTFITMIIGCAKKIIIRSFLRHKNRMISQARSIEDV